jgi:oxygen-independent coproporphyrinogen-3 oxidase
VSFAGRERDIGRYAQTLNVEIARAANEFGRLKLDTIFFGGGTPSILPFEAITELLRAIGSEFCVADDAEISIEANPGTLDYRDLIEYRRAGINRLSMGIQSFNDASLRAINRAHTPEQAAGAVDLARRAGFTNINADLIYGLPKQTAHTWRKTLIRAIDLRPEHLSCYGMTLERDTPIYNAVRSGACALPREDEIVEMLHNTSAMLASAGYMRYEISNYARPGYECRHNLTYWRRGNYLGLGCAAHSLIDERRYQNTENLDEYMSGTARVKTESLSRDDARVETLMLNLRLREGLDLCAFRAVFGEDLAETRSHEIASLKDGGYAFIDQGRLKLTDAGMNVQNAVLMQLL